MTTTSTALAKACPSLQHRKIVGMLPEERALLDAARPVCDLPTPRFPNNPQAIDALGSNWRKIGVEKIEAD